MKSSPVTQAMQLLEPDWGGYRALLIEVLASDNPLLNQINQYLFEHGGKQIRPMLALLTARAICGKTDSTIDLSRAQSCAAVAELIHTATLLHDDVADDSDVRRGHATVKALFSPAASVLMGDFWLSRGLKLLIKNRCDYGVLESFALAIDKLSSGEMLQMERAEDIQTTEEDYFKIISLKTSSLFVATLHSTAIEMNASPAICERICEFAELLGLSFQIRDDIFDYSPAMDTGKLGGSDILERKITLPLLGAFHHAEQTTEGKKAKDTLLQAIRRIDPTTPCPDDQIAQKQALEFVQQYDGISYAEEALNRCVAQAKEALAILPDSDYRQVLLELTDYMCYRTR